MKRPLNFYPPPQYENNPNYPPSDYQKFDNPRIYISPRIGESKLFQNSPYGFRYISPVTHKFDSSEMIPSTPIHNPMNLVIDSNFSSQNTGRKMCNCDKTYCLKLYCDCFKSGQMCVGCNCKNCRNNEEHDDERIAAINNILSKNKDAFKSRISGVSKDKVLQHHRNGCHCSKSNCLKGYCECFQNKILCGKNCRCVDCHNSPEFRQQAMNYNIEKIVNDSQKQSIENVKRLLDLPKSDGRTSDSLPEISSVSPSHDRPLLLEMADAAINQLIQIDRNVDIKSIISENFDAIILKIAEVINECIKSYGNIDTIHDEEKIIEKVLESFKTCLKNILDNKNP